MISKCKHELLGSMCGELRCVALLNCVLLVSHISLLSFIIAGPASHAAISARCTQQEAHELCRQRLRLHHYRQLNWTCNRPLLWGRHTGNRAGEGVWEKQRCAMNRLRHLEKIQMKYWWCQFWPVSNSKRTCTASVGEEHFKSKQSCGNFVICIKYNNVHRLFLLKHEYFNSLQKFEWSNF